MEARMSDDAQLVNLGGARGAESQTCKAWTVPEMREAALRETRSGETKPIKAALVYMDEMPGGGWGPRFYAAGVTHSEYIAMLTLCLHKAIDEWKA